MERVRAVCSRRRRTGARGSRQERGPPRARGARQRIPADDRERRLRIPALYGSPSRRTDAGGRRRLAPRAGAIRTPAGRAVLGLRLLVGAPGDAAGGLRALASGGSVRSRFAAARTDQGRATGGRAHAHEGERGAGPADRAGLAGEALRGGRAGPTAPTAGTTSLRTGSAGLATGAG